MEARRLVQRGRQQHRRTLRPARHQQRQAEHAEGGLLPVRRVAFGGDAAHGGQAGLGAVLAALDAGGPALAPEGGGDARGQHPAAAGPARRAFPAARQHARPHQGEEARILAVAQRAPGDVLRAFMGAGDVAARRQAGPVGQVDQRGRGMRDDRDEGARPRRGQAAQRLHLLGLGAEFVVRDQQGEGFAAAHALVPHQRAEVAVLGVLHGALVADDLALGQRQQLHHDGAFVLRLQEAVQGPPGGLERHEARVVADGGLHQRDHRLDLRERAVFRPAGGGKGGALRLGRGEHGRERILGAVDRIRHRDLLRFAMAR